MGATVRPAKVADAAAIAGIFNAGIGERIATFETDQRTVGDVETWIAAPAPVPVLVADLEGTIAGFVSNSPYSPRACYSGIRDFSVYVDPTHRGQGIAMGFMQDLIARAAAAGVWKLTSRIFADNRASLELCARCGFREVGVLRRHGKLDGEWRDCVIVERLLGEAEA